MAAGVSPRLIYADTSAWNLLCDQKIPAREMLSRLAEVNAALVLGDHAVHELAKTITSSRPSRRQRAAALFAYLRDYLEAGVLLIKPNWALMIEEALHMAGNAGPPEALLVADANRAVLRGHVEELVCERVDPAIQQEIDYRTFASTDHTDSMKAVLAREIILSAHLRTINTKNLQAWITGQTTTPIGVECLQINLRSQFEKNTDHELREISRRLLDRPRYRVSRALTRTTLYSLWRCANFGTVPRDFNDDTLHLTNASYCDYFVTADPQHEKQRAEVFDTCQVLIYSESTNLLESLPNKIREFEQSRISVQTSHRA